MENNLLSTSERREQAGTNHLVHIKLLNAKVANGIWKMVQILTFMHSQTFAGEKNNILVLINLKSYISYKAWKTNYKSVCQIYIKYPTFCNPLYIIGTPATTHQTSTR